MKNQVLAALLAGALSSAAAFAAADAWADDERFGLSTGFDYSTGKYGTAISTGIFSIPVTRKYETGPWAFKLTVPYVRISGAGNVVPGVGRIKTGGTTSSTQSGLGDAVAAASYNIYPGSASTPGVDLTGKVKLATADAGLGSGANDYAAQADVYQSLDKFTAMGSLGSKVLGSPSGITLNTVLYGSFGGSYQFTEQTSGGVDMGLAQNPSATGARQQEITAYVNHKIGKNLKAQGYLLKGLSDGSPDNGVGAAVSYGF